MILTPDMHPTRSLVNSGLSCRNMLSLFSGH
jgi:hypothetical protein